MKRKPAFIRTTLITALLFLLTTLPGCSRRPLPDSNRQLIDTIAVDTSFPGLTRILASDILLGSVVILAPKLLLSGDYTRAQVKVQNLTFNRYALEYQYQWEDDQGVALGTPRPWQRFVLGPNQIKTLPETSLYREGLQATFTLRVVDDHFIELNRQNSN